MNLHGRKLRVGAYDFLVKSDLDMQQACAVSNTTGFELGDELVIAVDPRLPPQRTLETLVHEGAHAAWEQTCLEKLYTNDQQEQIIGEMTPRIISLMIRDNRWMLRLLMEAYKK